MNPDNVRRGAASVPNEADGAMKVGRRGAASLPGSNAPASQTKRRILLVDDHPMVRERMAEAIQSEPDLAVCGEAEERFEALELIAATHPDLVVVDLSLKQSSGLELIKDIRARYSDCAVLVVSMHDEALHAERVMSAGALGYITKQEATEKIMQAIRTVLEGRAYLSEKMTSLIAAAALGARPRELSLPVSKLSDRELSVFEMIGQGHSTRQIAEDLRLDARTIETYRARIKEKLHLKDANELLQHAIAWMQGGGTSA